MASHKYSAARQESQDYSKEPGRTPKYYKRQLSTFLQRLHYSENARG